MSEPSMRDRILDEVRSIWGKRLLMAATDGSIGSYVYDRLREPMQGIPGKFFVIVTLHDGDVVLDVPGETEAQRARLAELGFGPKERP